MGEPTFKEIIYRIAALELELEALGPNPDSPMMKALKAERAKCFEEMDEARGTTAVVYQAFRDAFDKGLDCDVLVRLKSKMDKKNELYQAAADDLKAIGCYMASSRRTDRTAS